MAFACVSCIMYLTREGCFSCVHRGPYLQAHTRPEPGLGGWAHACGRNILCDGYDGILTGLQISFLAFYFPSLGVTHGNNPTERGEFLLPSQL